MIRIKKGDYVKGITKSITKWEKIRKEVQNKDNCSYVARYWIGCGYCDAYEICRVCPLNMEINESQRIPYCNTSGYNNSIAYQALLKADAFEYISSLVYINLLLDKMKKDLEKAKRRKNDERKCKECSKKEDGDWVESEAEKLVKYQLCFNCNFWREKVVVKDRPRVARINGNHFTMGQEERSSWSEFRGFGGRKFAILFNDGRKVETTNLWHQGKIPKHFKERLPDNAKFEPNTTLGSSHI